MEIFTPFSLLYIHGDGGSQPQDTVGVGGYLNSSHRVYYRDLLLVSRNQGLDGVMTVFLFGIDLDCFGEL